MIVAHVDPDQRAAAAVVAALASTEHRLAWSARTGAEALRRNQATRVDVLLLSVNVTDLSAAQITRQVLALAPCAIILLADTAGLGISNVYDAMGAGAQDVVPSPQLDSRGRALGADALLGKLRIASRLLGHSSTMLSSPVVVVGPALSSVPVLAIGASTGGPQALLALLTALPKPFPAAILLVQHVDREFTQGLASWLQEGSGIRVQLAQTGHSPEPGAALLASSDNHLVMTPGKCLRYQVEPRELLHRPSVDVLFASLAEHWPRPGVAVLLTGMGRDGAEGMLKLRNAGWHTVAQDQASSVVYGMPKAAAQLGAACKILALADIASEVSDKLSRSSAAARVC